MNKGVLKLKTKYSDSDFSVSWNKIKQLASTREFSISLVGGHRYDGYLHIVNPDLAFVFKGNDTLATTKPSDVVFLKSIKNEFWDRLSASVALGFNFTKSNDFKQFSLRSNLGYAARNWTINGNYNGIATTRDDAESVKRTDAAVSYRYALRNEWYPIAEVNWLSNTEQNIELRTVSKLGIGKYIIRTNQLYWGFQAGASYNNESFTEGDVTSQNSLEGFVATELNIFDKGDISLLTKAIAYPGITESGRLRVDGVIDLQYDLPLDFFLKLGLTINYDNKSSQVGKEYDYILQTSFGWEL